VQAALPVTIVYHTAVDGALTAPKAFANRALLDDGLGNVWERRAVAIANGYALYLPLTYRR
jgi:hypothetical protein